MDSVIGRLTEIEDAASAIVAHAQEQKAELDREYEDRKKAFDRQLEEETEKKLQAIRDELEEEKKRLLGGQMEGSQGSIALLKQEYEENHTRYAKEIQARMTEV